MSTWEEIAVPDALLDTSVGKQHQVLAQDIAPSGAYPVIDQGQSFIAGYCDDPSRVIDFALPVIIFGDHTRAFKYVDFPFVLGADGTKVLKPDPEQFDARYFYFAMLALDIPNRGYNRHFKILRERSIPKPPLPEQQRIAQVLSTVQEAIAQQERLIRTTTELKQALMQKLFTEGLRGEALKETEIGRVPESWVKVELGALGRIVTGTTPSTTVKEYYEPAEVDFIAPADIGKSRLVRDAQKKISAAGFAVARPLPKDAVMCVCIGATIGKVGMTAQAQSATNQQINTIICGENYDPRFVHYLLTQHAEYWRSFATFGPVPMLSKGAFEKIIFHVPSNKLDQTDSADALVALDDKIEVAQKKRNALRDLFRTLLDELMTGKVRVGET